MKSKDILLDTAEVLESTLDRIDRLTVLTEKEKERVKAKIKEAAENFRRLAEEVKKDNEELAEFFYKKAKEFKLMSTDKAIEREGKKNYLRLADRILLYSRSAEYDFKPEKLAELKKVYRRYLFGMTAFFVLTGFYLNQFLAITALILAIPIILSMLSLQRRGYLGLLLAYSAIPIPIIVGVMALRSSIYNLITPEKITEIMAKTHWSASTVKAYLVFLMLLSAVELYLIGSAIVGLYKHRHAFL
ncbi:alpha-glucosidase [Thermococcus sp.]|uniref:alpha-glucosidase n=1 Tax=Thermococcus sp. TaxID=35749 RepID=UPI002611FB09|nr:alpha-glucosidase [Thermococcus sp.]